LQLFKKNILLQPTGIEIKPSTLHGRGVFASTIFKSGAVIETAPVIIMQQTDKDFLQATTLFNYYFVIGDKNFPVALGLGYSSLYNHSYTANAVYSVSLKDETITIKACKAIQAGDEITLNYNGSPNDATPVYFAPEVTTT
jgi:hypothetical protein